MHRSLYFIIILFLSCNFNNNINDEIQAYYNKGNFLKIIELIKKYEYEHKKENPQLFLWKARIYSLYPESYGLAKYYYRKTLELNPFEEYYYEYTIFLIDIHDFNTIQELISGENISPSLIFQPKIGDIRNFLECRSKILDEKYFDVLSQLSFIDDLYLKNYCALLLYYNLYHKFLLKNKNNKDLNMLINLSSIEQLNNIINSNFFQQVDKDKIKQYLKDLILKYKEYNQQNILNNPSIYCSLEKHFPEFKISSLSMEKCKETFPTNLTLHRKIIYKKAIPIYSNPLFDNSLYIPVPRF
ncbi:MAG: hypothetical protein KatS3mg129_0561 [Leptospiraceae bacterium]|nr:MAG: hypothetical protein KatS3mg129_0561 [Leptospiraceae bacterium]